jgi:hypothetical protein
MYLLTTKTLARHPHWNRSSQRKSIALNSLKVQNFIYTEYHSPQDLQIYQMFCSKNPSMGGWLAIIYQLGGN